jgi:membrane-associated phospholipid phosphatase
MTQTLKTWLAGLLIVAALVSVSIRWLDKPIAEFFSKTAEQQRTPLELVERFFSIPSLAAGSFLICGLIAIAGRRPSRIEATIAISIVTVLVTTVIKDQLKFVFGRTWPYLLSQNMYGFNFFHAGRLYESFPSGHAAVAAAVLSIVCILFPTQRILCVIAIVAVDVGLVALNLHFLSDTVAGSFVGLSIGLFTVTLWKAVGKAGI